MITVWGLKTCDTCKKARSALDAAGAAYAFKDVRADGLTGDAIRDWLATTGAEALINRRSTTWRGLSEVDKARAEDPEDAMALLAEAPALIKRPVFVFPDGAVIVGFGPRERQAVEARL